MDLSNGNPDETWLKTAVRRYEEAANAALHTVLGLDVMTSIPDEAPLLINGTFLLFPKGVQKSVCFVYKLHIDDEYMPKLMEHLHTEKRPYFGPIVIIALHDCLPLRRKGLRISH